MKKNGKDSNSKRTKHIIVLYYFGTDRIEKYELSLDWCLKADITVDLMTNQLKFQSLRDYGIS